MHRCVYFVKYWDKGSTAVGADQMAPALRRLGVDARVVYAPELPEIRDALLVFVKRADITDLIAARIRGNRLVVDLQDTPVFRRWISHWPLYDAFIFRNRRQCRDFGRQVRLMGNLWAIRRTIYQHWHPRYGPHRAPDGELRVGYLGTRRSLSLWGQLPGVEFVGEGDWFERARGFNAHLSVRETRREWLYKPNAKVATAAACEAVLLTTPDCSSVELLGENYPFYLPGADRESILEGIERAREAVGGPEWHDALERLRRIKEATSLDRIAREYVELFRELE